MERAAETEVEEIHFTLNGHPVTCHVHPDRMLLDVLRTEFGIRSARYGCGLAQCGACTILVDESPARSCVLRVCHAQSTTIRTMEGLADPVSSGLHPVQEGFVAGQGAQCGYCLGGDGHDDRGSSGTEPHPHRARGQRHTEA